MEGESNIYILFISNIYTKWILY